MAQQRRPARRVAPRTVLIKPIRPRGPGIRFELIGDDTVTGGVGGWEDLPRPRRRAATDYVGTPAYTEVLPLLIDGTETSRGHDTPIEGRIRTLISWGVPRKGADRPAVLRISGPLRVPASKRWVIQDLEWGPQIRNQAGRRVQQYVTVTLKEYVEPVILRGPAAKSRGGKGGKG